MLELVAHADHDLTFHHETVVDNVSLLMPAMLHQVNGLVASTRHAVARKSAWHPSRGRIDSFVVQTDVWNPTDVHLPFNAKRLAAAVPATLS